MTAPAWMPFYVADYLADTGHLSTLEHGAYLLLIMHYWQNGQLPQDEAKLARIARMPLPDWAIISETMRALFGSGWTHKRIDAEITRASDMTGKRKAAGKAGAAARHGKRIAIAEQTHAGAQANAEQRFSISPSPSPKAAAAAAVQNSDPQRTRTDLDRIEAECRAAAGLENAAGPAFLNIAPLIGLIDRGYGLDLITTVLRSQRGKAKPRSWAYFVPAIEEAAAANEAIKPAPTPETQAETWAKRRPLMSRYQAIPDDWGQPSSWPPEVREWPEARQLIVTHANTTGEGWEPGMSQH